MSTINEEPPRTPPFATVESFFANGPLKVAHLKETFPLQHLMRHATRHATPHATIYNTSTTAQVDTDGRTAPVNNPPCTFQLTHVDTTSYPAQCVPEHTPAYKIYNAVVKDHATSEEHTKKIFLKYTGILDPNELVSNKYGDIEEECVSLTDEQKQAHIHTKQTKTQCVHNTAYVDSLACHLTSKLAEQNICPHFPIVYGIYSGIAEKHFVEFTEEYYDHRHSTSFREGIKQNKWCMLPNTSTSDSESETDIFGNDADDADDDVGKTDFDTMLSSLQAKPGESDMHALVEKLLIENEPTADADADADVRSDSQSDTEVTVVDTNTNTVHTDSAEFKSDEESHQSIFSNDSNSPLLDESELTELSLHDIDVIRIEKPTVHNSSTPPAPATEAEAAPGGTSLLLASTPCGVHTITSAENLLDDTDFVDTLPTHGEPLKLRNGCDFVDFQSRYLQMSNVPVQIVAMEAYELMFESLFKEEFTELQHYETLYTREMFLTGSNTEDVVRCCAFKWLYTTKQALFEKKWTALLCQVCMALVSIHHRYDMVHNDMHGQNIMLEKTSHPFLHYEVSGMFYKVPTFGYIVKLIDMGRTTYQLQDTLYMGDVFRASGEAGEQYSYVPQHPDASTDPEKRKHLLLPNPCFDLTRLACSLLDEFYGGAEYYENETDNTPYTQAPKGSPLHLDYSKNMFRPPTVSSMFNMLCEWITDATNQPVNRYENFDLYKQIARRMRCSLPLHQLHRPHFKAFQCEKETAIKYYHLTGDTEFNVGADCDMRRPIYNSDEDEDEDEDEGTEHLEDKLSDSSGYSESGEEDNIDGVSDTDNERKRALQNIIHELLTTPHTPSTIT